MILSSPEKKGERSRVDEIFVVYYDSFISTKEEVRKNAKVVSNGHTTLAFLCVMCYFDEVRVI